jgi:hypothetical protein
MSRATSLTDMFLFYREMRVFRPVLTVRFAKRMGKTLVLDS